MIQPYLCPVMRKAPGQDGALPALVRVKNQQRAARDACRGSARHLGLQLGEFERDDRGFPLPVDGWYWSVSHTRGVVCGVVYPAPIGIDVECVKKRRQEIVRAVASRTEYEVLEGFSWHNFARLLSAKQAVLKKAGCGLKELSYCLLVASPNARSIILHHRDRHHFVHQSFHHGHYVSISADVADDAEISWQWWKSEPNPGAGPTWEDFQ